MSNAEQRFAQQSLAGWCRAHGIHEIRSVLKQAAELAAGAESAEQLADQLQATAEATAICPMPEPVPAPLEDAPVKKRRAHAATGQFKADDNSTPDVDEAWAAD